MLHKTRGIVLHSVRYSETSLVVKILTEEAGLGSYIIKGARNPKAKIKASLFQPLTLLDLHIYFKPGRELQNIKEVRNRAPLIHLSGDPVKSAVALFLSEILGRALREEEPNAELFDFLDSHIQYLDLADQGVANFHLYFLLRLARYLGFAPALPSGDELHWFDLVSGTFTGVQPLHGSALPPPLAAWLARFLSVQPAELGLLSIDRQTRIDLLEGVLRYYSLHLEGLGEIRSHKVLHSLFD